VLIDNLRIRKFSDAVNVLASGAGKGFLFTGAARFGISKKLAQARRATWEFGGNFNQLYGSPSRNFRPFLCLPALEIGTQNEKFPADLNDPNLLFLNDSAEMPYREASQTGGVGNIKKHPFRGT
jgi:hypothetical protein